MSNISIFISQMLAAVLIILFAGCHKVPVGYLITEQASYQIDSLVVKSVPDTTPPRQEPNPLYDTYRAMGYPHEYLIQFGIYPTILVGGGEDYDRFRRGEPWTSNAIEGVEGTAPIIVKVTRIESLSGFDPKLLSYVTVRGNGVLTVPLDHHLPPGRYSISLSFSNEGYSKNLDKIFTIIVK